MEVLLIRLIKMPIVVISILQKGNTALHIASLAGQLDAVHTLVKLGAKVNIQSQVVGVLV